MLTIDAIIHKTDCMPMLMLSAMARLRHKEEFASSGVLSHRSLVEIDSERMHDDRFSVAFAKLMQAVIYVISLVFHIFPSHAHGSTLCRV